MSETTEKERTDVSFNTNDDQQGSNPHQSDSAPQDESSAAEGGPTEKSQEEPAKAEREKTDASTTPRSRDRRKKNMEPLPPGAHRVNFTVTIAKAIATDDDDLTDGRDGSTKKKRRVVEAPRAQNYFHYEYQLLPTSDEVIRTDVVTFGMAAKIYTEHQEPRVLKTWQDGSLTWVAWSHCHSVVVTEDLLKELFKHTLVLRVWDSKDKMSTRARFDRPKAFRLPPPKQGENGENYSGVKSIVLKQSRNYEKLQPKKSYIDRPLPNQPRSDDYVPRFAAKKRENSECAARRSREKKEAQISNTVIRNRKQSDLNDDENSRSYSNLVRLAGAESPVETLPEPRDSARVKSRKSNRDSAGRKQSVADTRQGSAAPSDTTADSNKDISKEPSVLSQSALPRSRRSRLKSDSIQTSADLARKNGVSVMEIKMNKLFAGMQNITERLASPVASVEDMFCTVSLNGPLLSEDNQKSLNPLVVRVHSVTNMPDTPLSYEELKARCQPAYVSYKLFNTPIHTSVGREQDKDIYFDDINVFLAGIMDPSEIREFLCGPPLTVEVHDRDRIPGKHKLKPALFGDDFEDQKISNVGTVTSRRTINNAFTGRDQPWDPHGVAKFDLSDLLLGHQFLYLKSPIMQCCLPDLLGTRERSEDGKIVGIAGALDGPVDSPHLTGHYMDTGAMMKIKIELTRPLLTPQEMADRTPLASASSCPFSRIVFRFNFKNVDFYNKLTSLVNSINAHTLKIDQLPDHVIEAALSTYKLTLEQQRSPTLNVITGFQIMDGNVHLFVLEGLQGQGVQTLWESLPKPEQEDVEVLFHSDMSHQQRLYGPLNVELCRIKLHEPLDLIVQQPLLYVRDMCPKPCFEALVKLHELLRVNKLRDALRNKLFPSAEMVVSMSKEFGVPIMGDEMEETATQKQESEVKAEPSLTSHRGTTRDWTPIDNYNAQFIEFLQDRENHPRPITDHCKRHKQMVKMISTENGVSRSRTVPPKIRAPLEEGHNYSTQTLNSTEQALEVIRQKIKEEDPDNLYTNCEAYHHSMTVVPVDVKAVRNEEKEASKKAWKTPNGWSYPGHKTMIMANQHPMKLDIAREEELRTPWQANILHRRDRPPLQRGAFTWSNRKGDFDNWTKACPVFGKDDPVTIQEAGDRLDKIRRDNMAEELEIWKSKLVVNDSMLHTHRCLPATELKDSGLKASNQVSKLQGLLKDPPVKHTLLKPPMGIREIPPLGVVNNPSVDVAARKLGENLEAAISGEMDNYDRGLFPGPFEELSCILEKNQIPVRDYEHRRFEQLKGQDFNPSHRERSNLHKRQIGPLKDSEYNNHLFNYNKMPTYGDTHFSGFYCLPALDDLKQMRNVTNDSGFGSVAEVK